MENKYGFNAYDTVIALILTQYLKTRDYKAELGKIIDENHINTSALVELLDRAALWASTNMVRSEEPLSGKVTDAVCLVLADFSGERYVHAMDAGFAEFLDDFYHDRIEQ